MKYRFMHKNKNGIVNFFRLEADTEEYLWKEVYDLINWYGWEIEDCEIDKNGIVISMPINMRETE